VGNLFWPYSLRKWLKSHRSAFERLKLYKIKSPVMPPLIVTGTTLFGDSFHN
jgi:hypothetical protein